MATQRESQTARRLELVESLAQSDLPAPLLDAVSAELDVEMAEPLAEESGNRLFVMRLTFEASGLQEAKELAARYAEALSLMRSEVLMFSTQVSQIAPGAEPEQVFCRTAGPYGLSCSGIAGHFGWHNSAASGPSWSDG